MAPPFIKNMCICWSEIKCLLSFRSTASTSYSWRGMSGFRRLQESIGMQEAFARLIKEQLLCANILVIENGVRRSDNLPDRITGISIHDTLRQIGSVNDAGVWFDEIDDAYNTHALINQMKIGVTTCVVA